MTFTPLEFFGAAARCSYMHVVLPSVVTPESLMISALVEQHVDDHSADFAVLNTADSFKDYIKSYFAGTVAAGIAYLQMIRDGYVWSDHFEKLMPGVSGARPDFVFSRSGSTDVALMESKGTRSDTVSGFDATVKNGYLSQVEPTLGTPLGSGFSTHGFCIGGWLKSPTKAEMNVHHTSTHPSGGPRGGSRAGSGNAAVQRGNYAVALGLAHSPELARAIRSGQPPDGPILFFEFEWIGRRFVTAWSIAREFDACALEPPFKRTLNSSLKGSPFSFQGFALESDIASRVLSQAFRVAQPDSMDIVPIEGEVTALATRAGGALFPDGLAVLREENDVADQRPVVWQPETGQFAAVGQFVDLRNTGARARFTTPVHKQEWLDFQRRIPLKTDENF